MPFYPSDIKYSSSFTAVDYEYSSVILPKNKLKYLTGKVLSGEEMKKIGISLTSDWENYMIHTPEPHVLLIRKKI